MPTSILWFRRDLRLGDHPALLAAREAAGIDGVASFLVKELHQEWTLGARYFMEHLVDGDLASNNHGWQWVAGTGTDAAPFYRVFNPVTQGEKFDPHGEYVKRWVPELRGLDARHVHEPWTAPGGIPAGYPAPIVDHAHERRIALERYERVRAGA